MEFKAPLLKGKLIKRYKRFMADIELVGGEVITAHCANSGALLGVTDPGHTVYVSRSDNPTRKLKYTWEMVEIGGQLIGVNTSHPNALVAEALTQGVIKELQAYKTFKAEVKYGSHSRIDWLLSGVGLPDCYLEVKNVHLSRTPGLAEFPDCTTDRGAKHLTELSKIISTGGRGVLIYVIQRTDCDRFCIARDLDPVYFEASEHARKAGVEFLAYSCHMSEQEIKLEKHVMIQ